ncbi:AlpA family transcriptional regulator [Desulfovibrio sp. OttesenSCG-928-C06]|nr:AlpA family transcriptional regulator [Desulfovibrio sp. OttesenSCG-928-C06]
MSQERPSIPTTGFLRLPQVLAIVPICKSSWYAGCRSGRYPKPVKLGPRTTAWRAEDIAAFISKFNEEQGAADE